jgi:hypothetical protein
MTDNPSLEEVLARVDAVITRYAQLRDSARSQGNELYEIAEQVDQGAQILSAGRDLLARSSSNSDTTPLIKKVQGWTAAQVPIIGHAAEPHDYPCTRYILRINRVQESVIMTRSTISRSGTCKGLLTRDLVMRLGESSDPFAAQADGDQVLPLYNFGPAARTAFGLPPR